MIITKEIIKKVTQYNLRIFKKFGYKIGETAIVKIEDWDKNSHEKINAKCDICGNERYLSYREYIRSFNNYNLYSCSSKCSQFKNKITKEIKYGDANYYNINKCKETCMIKYGVDNIFKDKEIIKNIDKVKRVKYGENFEKITERMEESMLSKYGVTNISKLDSVKKTKTETLFKNYGVYHMMHSNILKEISKKTCLIKYGYEYPTQSETIKEKTKNTCLIKYGNIYFVNSNKYKEMIQMKYGMLVNFPLDILNAWKLTDDYKNRKSEIYEKIRKTNIANKNWFSNKNGEYIKYRRLVLSHTNRNIFEKWNGYDYYDNEYIKDNLLLNYNDKAYPTIDHKISVKYGFINNIDPNIIGNKENLCITKRSINSSKNSKNEKDFYSNSRND